ncbi:MAG TPA: hypothetical protein VK437_10790 [Steroidobacteraceae bacterium]|nr:hypothetical protein [Steroidobacteraceae bacterium]
MTFCSSETASWAPATIAHATYAGRRYGEEFDALPQAEGKVPFRRELAELAGAVEAGPAARG